MTTQLDEAPVVVTKTATERPKITHWVCCRDEDRAFCSTNVAGQPLLSARDHVDCIVCDDIAEQVDDACPFGGGPCPV